MLIDDLTDDRAKASQRHNELIMGRTASSSGGLPPISGSRQFRGPNGGDVSMPAVIDAETGKTAEDVQRRVSEGRAGTAERPAPPTPYEGEISKPAEAVAADRRRMQDEILAAFRAAAASGDPVGADGPNFKPVPQAPAGDYGVEMSTSDMFALQRAVRETPGISARRRSDMEKAIHRIRRNEASADDFQVLQRLRTEQPYKRTWERRTVRGGVERQEAVTSYSQKGREAEAALERLIAQPSRDAMANISGVLASGKIRDTGQLYAAIAGQTSLPPELVIGQGIIDEGRRYFETTGQREFKGEVPGFPLLTSLARIARSEQERDKLELDKELARHNIEHKASVDLETTLLANAYSSGFGSVPDHMAFKNWAAEKGVNPADTSPQTRAWYEKEKREGRVAGAPTGGGGVSVAPKTAYERHFTGNNADARIGVNRLGSEMGAAYATLDPANDSIAKAHDVLVAAAASAVPGLSPDRAEAVVGEDVDRRVREFEEARKAQEEMAAAGEARASMDRLGQYLRGMPESSVQGEAGGELFVDFKSWFGRVADALGLGDDLQAIMERDTPPDDSSMRDMKNILVQAHETFVRKYAENLVAQGATNPEMAKFVYKNSAGQWPDGSEVVGLSDTQAVLKLPNSKIAYPVLNLPDGVLGEQLRAMDLNKMPKAIQDLVEQYAKDPSMFRMAHVAMGNESRLIPVYDGRMWAAALFGAEAGTDLGGGKVLEKKFPGILKRVVVPQHILERLPENKRHLAYQISDDDLGVYMNPDVSLASVLAPDATSAGGKWESMGKDVVDLFNATRVSRQEGDNTGRVAATDAFANHFSSKFKKLKVFSSSGMSEEGAGRYLKSLFLHKHPEGEFIRTLLESGDLDQYSRAYSMVVSDFWRLQEDSATMETATAMAEVAKIEDAAHRSASEYYRAIGKGEQYESLTGFDRLEAAISAATAGDHGEAISLATSISAEAKSQMIGLSKAMERLRVGGFAPSGVIQGYHKKLSDMADRMDLLARTIETRQNRGVEPMFSLDETDVRYRGQMIIRRRRMGD